MPVEDCQVPVVPEPGDCINLPGDCHDDDTEDDTEEEKEEGSSVVGGAFLGLSALAGLAFSERSPSVWWPWPRVFC